VRTWNTDTSGTGKSILRIANSGNNAQGTQLQFTDLNYFVGTIATDRTNGMAFYVGQQATALVSERMRIDINGNVGIGTTSVVTKFVVNGGTTNTTTYTSSESRIADGSIHLMKTVAGGIFESIRAMNADTTAGTTVRFLAASTSDPFNNTNGGKVFIDAIRTSTNMDLAFSLNDVAGAAPTERVRFMGNGNVGIGTTAPAYKLEVNGSFAASTKSFKIDHPTKTGKKLVYGSLESPYHGIRLTGKDKLVNGKCKVQLPDYICKLVRSESVNVQLTGIKCGKTLYIDDINISENYFVVAYDKSLLESNKTYEFFWDFTAIRSDVPELITEV
jgi:hypothetical protein